MVLYFKQSGSGPPLVIVHGLFGSGDNWATLAKYFAHQFTVVTVDMRNHGHSPHDPEMNYDVMALDLFDTLAHAGLREVNLLGHSMGGKAVMRFAQLYNFLVNKLIVADISPRYYQPHHKQIFDALNALDFSILKSRAEASQVLREKLNDATTEQFILKNLFWIREGILGLRFNTAALEKNIDRIGEAIPEVIVPNETLFVRGSKSSYVRNEEWPRILQLFPGARLETIENAGHWLHADQPDQFAKTITSFLNG